MNNLKLIIDEKSYRTAKGADWPTYKNFIEENYNVSPTINEEINEFVKSMQVRNENLTSRKTLELSITNQQRQGQVFYDKKFSGNKCQVPWQTLGINSNGNIFICQSPSWIPIFVGNILEANSIYDILNSVTAKKIRQEILEGRYYYCNSKICGFFSSKNPSTFQKDFTENDTAATEFIDDPRLYVNEIPTELIFDFDYTCNFKCPSCRTEYKNWNNHTVIRPINDKIVEKIKVLIINEIKDQVVKIRWCGGEPFMSDSYIDLFNYIIAKQKNNIQNIIQTNGSLFIAKQDLLKNFLPYIAEMRISFDAGTEKTYNLTRVGGQWDNLLKNVKFLMDLIKVNGHRTHVSADFVVQRHNYKDLPQYVNLCKELEINIIKTQKMWNWGTWDNETFNSMNIYRPEHELYSDLEKYFKLANLPMAKN